MEDEDREGKKVGSRHTKRTMSRRVDGESSDWVGVRNPFDKRNYSTKRHKEVDLSKMTRNQNQLHSERMCLVKTRMGTESRVFTKRRYRL